MLPISVVAVLVARTLVAVGDVGIASNKHTAPVNKATATINEFKETLNFTGAAGHPSLVPLRFV